MTLILTCLTNDFVLQASDRRLTETTSEKVVQFKDQNKALIYRNHFTFAITGMARFVDIPTIDWAAQRFSEKQNLWYAVRDLESAVTEQLNSKRIRDYYAKFPVSVKCLALVGAGFAHREVNGTHVLAPLRIVISNFYRRMDGAWVPVPYQQFTSTRDWLPDDKDFEVFEAGVLLSKERREVLTNRIKLCLQNKEGPEAVAALLVSEIQSVSDECDRVGRDIMCAFVPSASRESDNLNIHFGGMLLQPHVPSAEPQTIEPAGNVSVRERIAFLPPHDSPQFIYIDGKNKVFPLHSLIHVVFGRVQGPVDVEGLSVTMPPIVPIETEPPDPPFSIE